MPSFSDRLIAWQHRHGRHDLPWQRTTEPYRVWLSEIMLQQTQVATVIPYYERFLARFPTLESLAGAPVEEVMALWSGLGYYARARNLHRCAQALMTHHAGQFPRDPAVIASLPGIGRSTANAIADFCFGAREPILDGNVKRVLCRYLGIEGFPGNAAIEARLWQEAAELLPGKEVAAYIQAQMDLGATLCTRKRPRCTACPVAAGCIARRDGLTDELPTPRAKKPLPEKTVTLLVLRAGKQVAFEMRPDNGIWGGLLSLPELPEGVEPANFCAQQLGLRIRAVLPGLTFTHGFTHFRLHIQPLFCAVVGRPGRANSALRWLAPGEWVQAPLPAPVRKLLNAIP